MPCPNPYSPASDPSSRSAIIVLLAVLFLVPLWWRESSRSLPTLRAAEQQNPPARRPSQSSSGDWLLWGGPHRDFKSPSRGLAVTWPAKGPRRVWSRQLGEGYSAAAIEGSRLYTAYSTTTHVNVAALDAQTGTPVWQHQYEKSWRSNDRDLGDGPFSMPQIVGDRVVTVDGGARLYSLDKKTGKPVWSRDLYGEFGGSRMEYGYSCHALPFKDTLIMMVGGPRNALMSFRQKDGTVVWGRHSFPNSHSSPVLINVDGQEQVVALMGQQVVGVEPVTGEILWQHPHPTPYNLAISTPVWGPDNILIVSSAYDSGTRALHLTRQAGKTAVKELWHNRRVQVHFGTMIRIDNTVYGSSGEDGPAQITALDVKSGNILWQSGRQFAKAQLVLADGKFIVVDQDGVLALTSASPKGLHVHAKASLLQSLAWTPPTLAGTRLYIRDRKSLIALDLGPP
jgi:outer membrane protein assembly factor BamB